MVRVVAEALERHRRLPLGGDDSLPRRSVTVQ